MHDPSVLVFGVKKPVSLDIWHDEPGGRDAGEVCGYPPKPFGRRLSWTVRHAGHLHFRWWPYLNVKRWIVDRCAECGQRFRWKDARFSYQSTDKVWHDVCMSLRSVRSQLDDATKYLLAEADDTTRWRVEYRLKGIEKARSEEKGEGRG